MEQHSGVKVHSVTYNFIMSMVLKMSTFIFPLITFPYTSRILLADGNGRIAIATSIISYFSMVATLGIPTYGIRACAQCRDDKEKLSRTVQELLIINSCTMVITYLIFIVAILVIPQFQEDRTLLIISSATIALNVMGVEWLYQAIEQYDYITYRNIAFKILSIILMFVFVHSPGDYVIYATINVIGTVGANILNIINLRKIIYIRSMRPFDLKQHIKPIIVLFGFCVASNVYTNLDTVMLGFLSSREQAGYYSAATKTKGLLLSVVTALGVVLLPRISYYLKKKMHEAFQDVVLKSVQFTLFIALPIVAFFVIESGKMIQILAGSAYLPAVLPMQIITPTILIIGLSNITGIQISVPLGKEKYTMISTVVGAVVDLILNAIFIPKFGAAGAAFGTLIAEISVLIVQFYCLRNEHIQFIQRKEALKVVLATGVSCLLLGVFEYFISMVVFVKLVFAAAIFFGCYGAILLATKEKMAMMSVGKIGSTVSRLLFRK